MIFTNDELASYPGAAGMPAETVTLLRELAQARIYALVPQNVAEASPIARGIALEMVTRAYRNPGGFASETVDDYTYRRDPDTRTAGVYLTSDERADLLGLVPGAARSRARSIRLRSWSVPELP